jgi:hypothetical protein
MGEEEQAVLATLQALLNAIADRDPEGMSELLVPEGSVTFSRDRKISHMQLRDFPGRLPGGTERLEERFHDPFVRVDDDIAVAWAHYDFLVDGEVRHRGTSIISFLNENGKWRVCGITDTARTGPRPPDWGTP